MRRPFLTALTCWFERSFVGSRYPVILREFSLRTGSGGGGGADGRAGGDGVIRRVQFRRDGMTVSLLSERRSRAPPGAAPPSVIFYVSPI